VDEDLLDDAGIGEEGEELAFTAAARAGQHLEEEDTFEELGPGVSPPRTRSGSGVGRLSCVRGMARVLALDLGVGVRLGHGNDSIAEGGCRSEDPVVGGEVHAGSRDEGGEAFDQGQGVEDHMCRTVLPTTFELVEHLLETAIQI
jgi:hypothetical protein